ncbi:MAG: hypothetical protein CMH62_03070 [Nanoarchaeota archaeon]|nr:hypothetical protein [Nanoarchaeota archaeon]|tara:strand:+ start:2305 stop:2550 length:246 start_codon:yes stop_codon:yes gene_type:complete
MKKITLLVIAFLLVGAYAITTKQDYDLKENSEDRRGFLKDFSGWIVNLGKNTKEIADVAKEQDWLPDDEDFEERKDNDSVK